MQRTPSNAQQLAARVVRSLLPVRGPLQVLTLGSDAQRLSEPLPEADCTPFDPADAERLPFRPGAFDVVVAPELLDSVPDSRREEVLREVARVAARWVVVSDHFASPAEEAAQELVEEFLGTEPDLAFEEGPAFPRRVHSQLDRLGADVVQWVAPTAGRFQAIVAGFAGERLRSA